MDTHKLSFDTQAILLLCGRFGAAQSDTAPLSAADYHRLAQWLHNQQLRPADLLEPDGMQRVRDAGGELLFDLERLVRLCDRGAALALTLEGWTNKGLWVLSRSDAAYPQLLKARLRQDAPPILYGAGDAALLAGGGLAIVGSRDVDERGLQFTRAVAQACARQGLPVLSGAARGVDAEAMQAALAEGGSVVGVLAESLVKAAVAGKYRASLRDGQLALISPYDPEAGFSVGNAMGRNKYIYSLSDYALVISAALEQGGTWHGATENLKRGWVPLFVRSDSATPPGNQRLLERGGIAIDDLLLDEQTSITRWLAQHAAAEAELHLALEDAQTTTNGRTPAQNDAPRSNQSVPVQSKHDLFAVVWPYLEQALQTARTEAELAELFQIEKAQARRWLQRAVGSGKATKLSKPVRYIALSQSPHAETLPMF